MKVYLSGPITGLTYVQADSLRVNAEQLLTAAGLVCVTPMRHLDMKGKNTREATCGSVETARRVVQRDAFDVRNCDIILVDLSYTERVSIGTVWEMGVAYALNKPIFVVCDKRHKHAMTLHGVGWRCDTIEEAVAEIINLAKPYVEA